jgi:predicted phage tail component-like protein
MGITFNGVHSSIFGLGAKVTRPLTPGNNDKYVDIPGRSGSILFPGKLQDRLISVEFGFMPGNRAVFREKVWEISAWLNTEERKILIIDDDPGKSYVGKVEDKIDLEQAYRLGKFAATFRCEPFAYGAEVTSNFVNDSITATNVGTCPTPAVIDATFTAAATEFKVALGTEYIRIGHSFTIGDTLQIDTGTGSALINGSRAMDDLDWQNSRFFALASGENALAITPVGICTATVKHIPRWL